MWVGNVWELSLHLCERRGAAKTGENKLYPWASALLSKTSWATDLNSSYAQPHFSDKFGCLTADTCQSQEEIRSKVMKIWSKRMKSHPLKGHCPALLYASKPFWFVTSSHCDRPIRRVHFAESGCWSTQGLTLRSWCLHLEEPIRSFMGQKPTVIFSRSWELEALDYTTSGKIFLSHFSRFHIYELLYDICFLKTPKLEKLILKLISAQVQCHCHRPWCKRVCVWSQHPPQKQTHQNVEGPQDSGAKVPKTPGS